ncbi:hypothetical protein EB796_009206 [Bugula neritina]|nr:hypothetical protein EB796_009206 [Bugula neritina]
MLYSYDGPLKPVNTAIGDAFCSSHWYANILYVNNVVKPLEQCAPWSWYLSDDFQYFLLTPFVVYIYTGQLGTQSMFLS